MSEPEASLRLVVGLGNPGPQYAETRHNAGFWLVDELARQHGGHFRPEAKYHGETCRIALAGQELWLLKPMTFMNRSGLAVAALARFHRIPLPAMLVVHDDLDLPPGVVAVQAGWRSRRSQRPARSHRPVGRQRFSAVAARHRPSRRQPRGAGLRAASRAPQRNGRCWNRPLPTPCANCRASSPGSGNGRCTPCTAGASIFPVRPGGFFLKRVAMGIQCGIVGLPNVGKSTLFNALTKAGIQAENYPFCTIDPNVGVVPVPDPRLDALAAIVKPKQIIPATVEFVDIAGLVAGASKGEGWATSFWPTSARPTPSPTWCAASRTTT